MSATPDVQTRDDAHVWLRLPRSGPITAEYLAELPPDTGLRFELLDGSLIVTPGPHLRHQRSARDLFRLLDRTCPDGMEALFAPFDVIPTVERAFQPDLLVARTVELEGDAAGRGVLRPLLCVEVRSPSTRLIDQHLKRAAYEEAQVPSYWLLDPQEPRLTVLELQRGRYVQVADVGPGESWTAARPYPVEVRLPG